MYVVNQTYLSTPKKPASGNRGHVLVLFSSLTHSNTKNDDSREPVADDRTNNDSGSIKDEERRGHGEYAPSYDPADSRRDYRDSRYDPRRREEDYRHDSRYGGGWDQRPDRTFRDDGYGDARPRHEHQLRPSSR